VISEEGNVARHPDFHELVPNNATEAVSASTIEPECRAILEVQQLGAREQKTSTCT
jgi:hypothetical protein